MSRPILFTFGAHLPAQRAQVASEAAFTRAVDAEKRGRATAGCVYLIQALRHAREAESLKVVRR